MSLRRTRALAVLALAVVTGHVIDRTTGQPLTHVAVTATGPKTVRATTNDDGAFALRGVPPGRYRVTLESDDVPPQTSELVVTKAPKQTRDFVACSTTLDYRCAP